MDGFGRYIIPASRLWAGETGYEAPLAIVDLDETAEWPEVPALLPCPVIGIGDPAHPFGRLLDAVIEPPITLEALARSVLAHPVAAAVTAQLLRLLPSLPVHSALAAESMAYGLLQAGAEHGAWLASRERKARSGVGAVAVRRDGSQLAVTLNDPDHGNAIDRTMRDALHDALSLAALDAQVERVHLRAAGRSFSLGAELAEFGTTTDPARAHMIRGVTLPALAAARCADKLWVHVQGACVGAGLELAAWGRRISASPQAWFQLPELAMGILPGAGGCVSLSRRIGRQRTALLILSGKRLSARQALAWGLIDEIAADDGGADIG